jgi:hypothetical protein
VYCCSPPPKSSVGSQQQDLISHAFADRLGVKGVLKGAAAQADGTRIPLYDVVNLQLSVNGVPTVRRFERADIKPFDAILGESFSRIKLKNSPLISHSRGSVRSD